MLFRNLFNMIFLKAILFCLITSCSKQSVNTISNNNDSTMINHDSTNNTDTSKTYTFLALGDSYTIGQSVNEDERFPAQTINLLKDDSIKFSSPKYIATTGWTCQNLLDAIASKNPKGPFDVVTLLIGVNDQYQKRDTTGYRENFTTCLQKAISLAVNPQHVFVVSIPDYSVTPFAQNDDTALIRKQIDEFNEINKEVTLLYKISYTYITELTREAKNDSSLIANDGLHPSGKEYAKWAALLAPQIKKILQ